MPKTIIEDLERKLAKEIGPNRNLIRELAELLDLSTESIYRRFRGVTSFNMNELWLLQREYGISLDRLLGNERRISVDFEPISRNNGGLESSLIGVLAGLQRYSRSAGSRLTALAADVPMFRLFGYDGLTQFKLHYWKSISGIRPELNEKFEVVQDFEHPVTEEIHTVFQRFDIEEIWSKNTLLGTLKQMEYYIDCGIMTNTDSIEILYRDLLQLVCDIVYHPGNNLKLYQYELEFNNNTFHVACDDGEEVLAVGVFGFNSIQSSDHQLTNEFRMWLNGVKARSLKVSGQSQKQKFLLYNRMKEVIVHSASSRLPEYNQKELISRF